MDHYGFAMIARAALFDEDILSTKKPFTTTTAFLWMVREARIKPTVIFVGDRKISLESGQLSFSYRFLAEKFGWKLGKTQRYIQRIKNKGFIDTDTSQGQLVVTICDPTTFTREKNLLRDRPDTTTDTATDTQSVQRKNIENIDIKKKEHLPESSDPNPEKSQSVQKKYLDLLRSTGVEANRGKGLLKKWGREHGLETTNKALEKCLAATPNDPVAWVFSNLTGSMKNECNSESGKSPNLGAAADRAIDSIRPGIFTDHRNE